MRGVFLCSVKIAAPNSKAVFAQTVAHPHKRPSAPNYQQPVDLGSQQQPVSDYQQPFAPGFQQQPPVPPKTKKKFPIWLLIILIVAGVLIVVCSAVGILVAVNSNNSGGTSQSNSEAPSGITVSNDFDSGTTEFTMDTLTMQIPSAWYEKESDDDVIYFYPLLDTGTSFLMIQYETDISFDVTNEQSFELYLDGMKESMHRHTIRFLPFAVHVHRRYGVPHSPQTSSSVRAYFPQYLPCSVVEPICLTFLFEARLASSSWASAKVSSSMIAG